MTFWTLTCNGVEKTLADLLIDESSAHRTDNNLGGDSLAFDMLLDADANDPFPFGAMVVLRRGRTTSAVNPVNATLPPSGATSFTGGEIFFIGYRVKTLRNASSTMEALQFKFAGPWEYFFEQTTFKKAFVTYNGVTGLVAYRSQIVLGLSLDTLSGPGDTVSGAAGTVLMSVRQQIIEIVQYLISVTTQQYGSPQAAFDNLTNVVDGTNYDLINATVAELKAAGAACLIPDFLPGYEPGANQTQDSANMLKVIRAPLDAATQISCAEALRRQLRWLGFGNPVAWFDYRTAAFNGAGVMTSPPTLRIGTRDNLPSVTLPWVGQTAASKIERRDDLIPSAVCCEFRIVSNAGPPQVVYDIAANISGVFTEGIGLAGLFQSPAQFYANPDPESGNLGITVTGQLTAASNAPRSQNFSIDMEGIQFISASISCVSAVAGDPDGESAGDPDYDFWTGLFPELLSVTDLKFYDAVNIPATVVDESGSAISLTDYPFRLLDGQVSPWMAPHADGTGLTKQGTITANFSYTETADDGTNSVNTKTVASHSKSHPITLTNLAAGVYTQSLAGELIPFGLAGFVFAMETIPHYDGVITIQEQEITDLCPIGSLLNLSGGRAEWATMNATVQSITYNLARGTTEITFGPPGHLGFKDFIELVRNNRGPRWIYQIGSNLANSQTAGLTMGANIPRHGSSPGNPINKYEVIYSSLPDAQANRTAYGADAGNPVYPGITHDAVGGTQYPGGGTGGAPGVPNAPLQHGAVGTGGDIATYYHLNANGVLVFEEVSSGIKLMLRLADIGSDFESNSSGDKVIKIREVNDCNGTTPGFRQALVSEFYTTALGNT